MNKRVIAFGHFITWSVWLILVTGKRRRQNLDRTGSDHGSDHGPDHGPDHGSDHGSDHRKKNNKVLKKKKIKNKNQTVYKMITNKK